jgi:hypothetical protein
VATSEVFNWENDLDKSPSKLGGTRLCCSSICHTLQQNDLNLVHFGTQEIIFKFNSGYTLSHDFLEVFFRNRVREKLGDSGRKERIANQGDLLSMLESLMSLTK